MKNRYYRTSFKAIAVVVSVLVLLGTALSVFAGVVMISNEFYTRTESALREDFLGRLMESQNATVFYDVVQEGAPKTASVYSGNYFYQIFDDKGNLIAGNYEEQPVQIRKESSFYWEDYLSEENRYRERRYTIVGYLAEEMSGTDLFSTVGGLLHFCYQVRYWVFIWAFFGLLLEVALLIYLFCSVGNHPGEEKPRLNPVDKFPFDLATILLYLVLGIQYATINNFGDLAVAILLVLFGTLDYLLFLWYFLTLASRLKVGGFFRSTLIGRFVLWMKRMLSDLLESLPLIWKTAVFIAVFTLFELILFISNIWEPDNLMILWVLERILLIPLALYIAVSLHKLKKGGERLAEGHLEERLDIGVLTGDFKRFGETLNSIGDGMNKAVEERMKSERFKTELITNVSHDIKTPLTSIINYVDLIKKEEPENEKVRQYLDVLDRQSARLKKLIEDLVEASKASTGNLSVHTEPCDAGVLLTQMIGEYDERFREKGLEPILTLPEEPVTVLADPRHFWRILDNLMVNVLKYAQSGTRVYLDLMKEKDRMIILFRNISSAPLHISGEELMERFVRGDSSRNTEGSGLGLSIARSLAELQGGTLLIRVDGDLFKVSLQFPVAPTLDDGVAL